MSSDVVEARAHGGDVTIVVNGVIAARAGTGELVHVAIPRDRCAFVRAIVGRSWSAPIYVGCG
jgi:hypothetical protein